MKRILSIVLILILSLGVLSACGKDKNETKSYDLDNAKATLVDLYPDLAPTKDNPTPTTRKDLHVVKVLTCTDGKYTVVWTTDSDSVKVVEYEGTDTLFNKDTAVTVKMPTDNDSEISYKLTATITAPDGKSTATVTFDLVAPAATKTLVAIKNPQAGVAYKFGMYQSQKGQTLFITGEMASTYYFGTTEDASVSPDVYLEATTGGYYVYTYLNGAKKYINMEVSGTHVNAVYRDAASTVVTITEDGALVTTVNDKTYAYGTYGTYTTIGTTDMSKEGYPVRLYAIGSHECSFEPATCTAPSACPGCGTTQGEALGHVDADTDHTCDREGCGAAVGTHADNGSGKCDYCGANMQTVGNLAATLDLLGNANLVSGSGAKNVFAANGITFTNDKASSSSDLTVQSSYAQRAYAKSTIKIEYTNMTAIVLTLDDYSDGKYLSGLDGMEIEGATITRTHDVVTITFSTPTNVFQSTELASQIRIEKIEVYTA